jgi:hypothetical protein
MASYVSELGWLASNVGTHVQSAEMHNQSVKCISICDLLMFYFGNLTRIGSLVLSRLFRDELLSKP